MTRFKNICVCNKLSISDEENNLIAHFLEKGCEIIGEEIKEKYGQRFEFNIDFNCLEKGEAGLKPLLEKIDSCDDFILINAHSVVKYNEKILSHLAKKNYYIWSHGFGAKSFQHEPDKNMISFATANYAMREQMLDDQIKESGNATKYYIHNGLRNANSNIKKYDSLDTFKSFFFEPPDDNTLIATEKDAKSIRLRIENIFSNLSPDDLIICDCGLNYFREVFSFLENNNCKNRVISLYGDLTGRVDKIPFYLLKTGGGFATYVDSLAHLDLVSKIFSGGITNKQKIQVRSSAYRLDRILFLADVLGKCSDDVIRNKNISGIMSAVKSFNGENDIFLGKRDSFSFDENLTRKPSQSMIWTYPNSLQIKDGSLQKILYKTQYTADIKKQSVIYSYIDIERVSNVIIQKGFYTAEFYLDIISNLEDPISEIIFNNLSVTNDKFTYKLIFEMDDNDGYSTKRYYVVANFDFVPLADNFPFDWQNIFISQTIKNSEKFLLQPIPDELVDKDFEIAEWEILNSFSGIKYKKNHLYEGVDLLRKAEISADNRVGWVLRRKNTATLLKIGIPLFFLIYLVYYSTFIGREFALDSIEILTTTFLSAIALYFSVEKPEPKKMTIVDLIFVWFYLINGVTIITYGSAAFISNDIFQYTTLLLKFFIPISLIGLIYHLYKRVKKNRQNIILDRDI